MRIIIFLQNGYDFPNTSCTTIILQNNICRILCLINRISWTDSQTYICKWFYIILSISDITNLFATESCFLLNLPQCFFLPFAATIEICPWKAFFKITYNLCIFSRNCREFIPSSIQFKNSINILHIHLLLFMSIRINNHRAVCNNTIYIKHN